MELKQQVRSHWEEEVCGTRFASSPDRQRFFEEISRARYAHERYIPAFADFAAYRGKRVLEIGVGAGSDFERWVLAGARATGIDLTESAIALTRERLRLRGVPDEAYRLAVSDAERLDFGVALDERGVAAAERKQLLVGALLHDIGKIGVPDSILRKPDKLTPDEQSVVRQHPIIGDRILAPIPQLQRARAVVLGHHERYDGQGYPYGLGGEDIPIAARIVTVADAFDAVTETRPYHTGESVVRALEELERGKGAHFDPKVVEAFFEVLQSVHKTRL